MKKNKIAILLFAIILSSITFLLIYLNLNLNDSNHNIKKDSLIDKSINSLMKWCEENDSIANFSEGDTSADWITYCYSIYSAKYNIELIDDYNNKTTKYAKSAEAYLEDDEKTLYLTDYDRMSIVLGQIGDKEYVKNKVNEKILIEENLSDEINGIAFALIAMQKNKELCGKDFDKYKEKYIEQILNKEIEKGGFAFLGDEPDVDMTAMVIQALAPYYSEQKIKEVIDRNVELLSKMQNDNGNFESYGVENSESLSQVIIALCCLGINPKNDDRFIKNDKNLIEVLVEYQNDDGGYSHIKELDSDEMSSSQAAEALIAYKLLDNNESIWGGKIYED